MTAPSPAPAGSSPRLARVRAPELTGRGWLNTGGRPLRLHELRGKVVLLDFWTSCCVNCLHVLDELRALEQRFADVLVVVGVHSPKFAHEAEPAAVRDAVERYGVHHPVLDDPELVTWQAYAARAWPTLAVVDPEGYVVAQLSGEGHAHGLGVLIDELVAEHEGRGTLHRGDGPYVPPRAAAGDLRFPAGAAALPAVRFDSGLLVSDGRGLTVLADDLVTVRLRIGAAGRGFQDGGPGEARFAVPQGLALLPAEVAAAVGYDVVVADSANHALRGVRLADGRVTTVAGTGQQLRQRTGGGPALEQELSTPWDVAWWPREDGTGELVVAMAGLHQLWSFVPAADPAAGRVSVLAGTSNEGLVDGTGARAWFAQPSGLAVSADGSTLWVADAETSALRRVRRTGEGVVVGTVTGQGLFDFGFRDGPGGEALLQHPLGVAVLPDGSVAVADTYNGAVRRYDPAADRVTTLARDLDEPTTVVVEAAGADGPARLVVVESTAHRLVRVPLPAAAASVAGDAQRVRRPVTEVAPGPVRLVVGFSPPTGQKLDDRWGDPTRLEVSASPPDLLVSGAGRGQGMHRDLVLAAAGEGVLHVSVQAAACDEGGGEGAACHLFQQDWGIPLRLVPDGSAELRLDLRGV